MNITQTVDGSLHDKKLYDTSQVEQQLEEKEAMMGDRDYQGIQHHHPAVLPDKKPKGGELPP